MRRVCKSLFLACDNRSVKVGFVDPQFTRNFSQRTGSPQHIGTFPVALGRISKQRLNAWASTSGSAL